MSQSCMYCLRGEALAGVALEICPLEVSTLYLFKNQYYRGRCIVALNDHKRELFELSADQLARFAKDVARAAAAIQKAFSPDKINYAIFGDNVSHVHMHLVPKYKGGPDWGGSFEITPRQEVTLSAQEYDERSRRIWALL